jgi:hypothetical protein
LIKYSLLILGIGLIASCNPPNTGRTEVTPGSTHSNVSTADSLSSDSVPYANDVSYFQSELEGEFKNYQYVNLDDTIHADLNGGGVPDKAIFTTVNGKQGILITHGETNEKVNIGFGNALEEMDDFGWVEYWALVRDSDTYEIVIEDDQIVGDTVVPLSQPSIAVKKAEVGGGVITFQNGKYIWIHQAD